MLQAVVQTNPQLKSPLQQVVVNVSPPAGVSVKEGSGGGIAPDGSGWDAVGRRLEWKVGSELVRERDAHGGCATAARHAAETERRWTASLQVTLRRSGSSTFGRTYPLNTSAFRASAVHAGLEVHVAIGR